MQSLCQFFMLMREGGETHTHTDKQHPLTQQTHLKAHCWKLKQVQRMIVVEHVFSDEPGVIGCFRSSIIRHPCPRNPVGGDQLLTASCACHFYSVFRRNPSEGTLTSEELRCIIASLARVSLTSSDRPLMGSCSWKMPPYTAMLLKDQDEP